MASSTWLISSFFKFSFPTRASQIHCQCNTNSNSSSRGIQRRWVEAFDQSLASPERFTVASYNILADRNASQHTDLYVNVPSRYINWNRRQKILSEELFEWNPDIICLQEVDMYVELSNILVKAGYAGSYKRRTGDTSDGCAMFWKADKFRLLDGESIQYKNIGLRDNVAQLLVFEIRFLSSKAQSLSEKWGNAPVILAGDFNSTPESGIYKFLSTSELNIKLYDRKQLSGQKRCRPAQVLGEKKETVGPFSSLDGLLDFWTDEEVKTATGDSECHLAVHPLKLNSSYATVNGSASTRGLNGEPLATSYHSKFLGTVDYLWYSEGIVPTRVLDTVSISDLLREGGLPCKKVGSDHLALLSEFSFSVAHNKSTDITAAAASPRVDIE
ncbi:carbon catabolite repressor protein 4 homolog 3 isoform X2 [Medicago truncatula]|uniref:carbon catabolite repressor protein 4 homolog 3 isoform X2 n=1 Tax=Medicago truncatula TaxID=3880 RepID=UPI000D2F3BAE|nr:carbon catabolite repressor protein 4 homolog 3 isoform X2 [Medicago truncatula]